MRRAVAHNGDMTDVVDLWFDPMCPWAWMASRWMLEVERLRDVDLRFRPMSLAALNEGRDLEPDMAAVMSAGWRPVRLVHAAVDHAGEGVVRDLYTALGTRYHPGGRDVDDVAVLGEALAEVGLPADLVDEAEDARWDAAIRRDRERVAGLVGADVGTPVLTVNGTSFFGPVVSPAPVGEEAVRLYDGCVLLSALPGFFELKRSRTVGPIFG